mgnify:CR=1 FL=1
MRINRLMCFLLAIFFFLLPITVLSQENPQKDALERIRQEQLEKGGTQKDALERIRQEQLEK